MTPAEAIIAALSKPTETLGPNAQEIRSQLLQMIGQLDPAIRNDIESDNITAETNQALSDMFAAMLSGPEKESRKKFLNRHLNNIVKNNIFNLGNVEKQVIVKVVEGNMNIAAGGNTKVYIEQVESLTLVYQEAPDPKLPLTDNDIDGIKYESENIISELEDYVRKLYIIFKVGLIIWISATVAVWISTGRFFYDVIAVQAFTILLYLFHKYGYEAKKKEKGAFAYLVRMVNRNPERDYNTLREKVDAYKGVKK